MIPEWIAEAAIWMARAVRLLPAIYELWNVVTSDTEQPDRELAAALEFVRVVKREKAKEEFGS